jgi:hypothetical protein
MVIKISRSARHDQPWLIPNSGCLSLKKVISRVALDYDCLSAPENQTIVTLSLTAGQIIYGFLKVLSDNFSTEKILRFLPQRAQRPPRKALKLCALCELCGSILRVWPQLPDFKKPLTRLPGAVGKAAVSS